MKVPAGATDEMERAVSTLGFCGTMIKGTTNDLFLDDAHNVWITTSGLFTQQPMQLAIDTFGVERILFSIDNPTATIR